MSWEKSTKTETKYFFFFVIFEDLIWQQLKFRVFVHCFKFILLVGTESNIFQKEIYSFAIFGDRKQEKLVFLSFENSNLNHFYQSNPYSSRYLSINKIITPYRSDRSFFYNCYVRNWSISVPSSYKTALLR